MRLKYIGPAQAVQVPLPPDNVADVTVERGHTHEFEDKHARSLLKQSDNWVEVAERSTKAKTTKRDDAPKAEDETPTADEKGSN